MSDQPDLKQDLSSAFKAGREAFRRAAPLPYVLIGLALLAKGILTHHVPSGVIGFLACLVVDPLYRFYHRPN